MLLAMVMDVSPEKKERTVKGDWCDHAKDLRRLSQFSL